MPIPFVLFPEFTRSTLPEPISFKDQQVIIVDADGARSLLFSNGKVWISPAGANAYSELADKVTAQIATDNISVATALASKATSVALNAHTGNVSNPHGLTKAQVGLSNADNTSDVAKPISTATQAAISAIVATTGDVTAAGVQNITGAKTFSSGALKTAGATSGATTLQSALVASGVLTLPAATDTLIARNTVDTLTNKTLTAPVIASILNGTGTLSLPSATDTLIGRATVDTLSNKTLVTPVLTGVPMAPTAVQGTNSTQIATTSYADVLGATKADANNPAFTGTPTGLTKTHVGLSNADNTSDTNKPVSTLQAAALTAKADANNPAFTGTPTGLTKAHIGLASVDNTSDSAKPISVLQLAALAGKQATLSAGSNISIVGNTISAAGGVAGASAIRVAESSVIPLDTDGEGKRMPFVAGQKISITADYTPTIGAGALLNGVCVADYVSSGTGNLILTNYNARGDAFAAESGRMFSVTYFKGAVGTFAIVLKGDLLDVIAPTLVSASVATATPTRVDLLFSEAINASWPAFSSFTVSGHTVTAATQLTPTTGYLAVSAFVNGEAPSALGYTIPGTNPLQDLTGNLLANITATSITNNITAAPGQVTGLTLGTATATTQPLTWTAPASNGGSAITDYLIEYKLAANATYTAFTHTASTTTGIVVTGLTASSSYNFRVSAINAIGSGASSAVGTGSTAAGAPASSITITKLAPAANATNPPSGAGAQTYWKRLFQNNSYEGAGVAFGPTASTTDVHVFTNITDAQTIGLAGDFNTVYAYIVTNKAAVARTLAHIAASGAGGRVRLWITCAFAGSSTQDTAHKPRIIASFADASASVMFEIDLSVYGGGSGQTSHVVDINFAPGAATVMNFGYEDPAPTLDGVGFHAMAYYPAP